MVAYRKTKHTHYTYSIVLLTLCDLLDIVGLEFEVINTDNHGGGMDATTAVEYLSKEG